jgi:osmotically inducible protein OsmC
LKESIVEKIEKVLALGNTHITVNRDPNVKRGALDLKQSAPGVESLEFIATELHPRIGQLFSGAWAG